MELIKVKIDELKPAPYNPRKKLKPGDKEYEKIKRSIQEFGYVEPVIINKDFTVIGGHQRITVLKDLQYTEIDCIIVEVDKSKEKALNVALNKISGSWDIPMLKDLLQELNAENYDVSFTGFDPDEIDDIMKKNSNPADIEQLLQEVDVAHAIEKPLWATVRTHPNKKDVLEQALSILENNGIRVERSYEK